MANNMSSYKISSDVELGIKEVQNMPVGNYLNIGSNPNMYGDSFISTDGGFYYPDRSANAGCWLRSGFESHACDLYKRIINVHHLHWADKSTTFGKQILI